MPTGSTRETTMQRTEPRFSEMDLVTMSDYERQALAGELAAIWSTTPIAPIALPRKDYR
jgi:hypothetical protein